MRYIILVLITLLSVVINNTLMVDVNIYGIRVDIILLIAASLAFIEKGVMPIVFAIITGLLTDVMFSQVFGVYALGNTIAVATVLFMFNSVQKFNFFAVFIVGALSYIIKEIVIGITVFLLGTQFDFMNMLVKYILPGALLAGGLIFPAYALLNKLFNWNMMKAKKSSNLLDEL